MPYISRDRKDEIGLHPQSVGELTYAIQQVLKRYIDGVEPSYQTYAECLGALRGAELDLWDRKVQPYEVAKREQNGDVW